MIPAEPWVVCGRAGQRGPGGSQRLRPPRSPARVQQVGRWSAKAWVDKDLPKLG